MNKKIPFTHEQLLEKLNYDHKTGEFTIRSSPLKAYEGRVTGSFTEARSGNIYFCLYLFGKQYSAADIAWFYHYGEWPKRRVWRKDGNPANVAISNLIVGKKRGDVENITLEWLHRSWKYDKKLKLYIWRCGHCKGQRVGSLHETERQRFYRVRVAKKRYPLHRLGWLYHFGEWPEGNLQARDGDYTNLDPKNFYYAEGSCSGTKERRRRMEVANLALERKANKKLAKRAQL